jgi:hypothetical protein
MPKVRSCNRVDFRRRGEMVGNFVDGYFNVAPLAGLNWAALYKWPG